MIGPRHDRDGGSLDRFTVAVLLLMLVLGFVAAVYIAESNFWRLLP